VFLQEIFPAGESRVNAVARTTIVLVAAGVLATLQVLMTGCASKPLIPWNTDVPPMVMVPVADAGVEDQRGRFREIFCTVLESRGESWPDYRPCEEALTTVADEPPGTGEPVNMGASSNDLLALLVPGVGWECVANWLKIDNSVDDLLQAFGYDTGVLQVDGLSSTTNNARQIYDGISALPSEFDHRPILLIGYSKGASDILEALVTYPELQQRVVAVISAAGAIGGSPLAETAKQKELNIMRYFPGSQCSQGDGGAIESLRPLTRRAWLAHHPLPKSVAYYSLVTFPEPERISSALKGMYNTLGQVDARNDGQLIFYDQVIPDSTLLGFVNADHWALAVPVAREHRFIGSTLVDQNDYPREALIEAVLRFIEEDLNKK
jgi:pimeloyl-ACP methyl ester carboxylesterase